MGEELGVAVVLVWLQMVGACMRMRLQLVPSFASGMGPAFECPLHLDGDVDT